MYDIVYSEKAEEDLAKLRRSEPAAFKKAVKLLNELVYHPRTGTGHPEPLKGDRSGQWSRTCLGSRFHEQSSLYITIYPFLNIT